MAHDRTNKSLLFPPLGHCACRSYIPQSGRHMMRASAVLAWRKQAKLTKPRLCRLLLTWKLKFLIRMVHLLPRSYPLSANEKNKLSGVVVNLVLFLVGINLESNEFKRAFIVQTSPLEVQAGMFLPLVVKLGKRSLQQGSVTREMGFNLVYCQKTVSYFQCHKQPSATSCLGSKIASRKDASRRNIMMAQWSGAASHITPPLFLPLSLQKLHHTCLKIPIPHCSATTQGSESQVQLVFHLALKFFWVISLLSQRLLLLGKQVDPVLDMQHLRRKQMRRFQNSWILNKFSASGSLGLQLRKPAGRLGVVSPCERSEN